MWWLGSVVVLAAAWRNPVGASRSLALFLGALWGWNAVAYHAWLFTRINPAAWFFAFLFAAQAALLFLAARTPVAYFSAAGPKRVLGISLVSYALVYPLLTLALGHTYPATPTFGVPCPTDLLTIGVLLTVRGGVPVRLAIIPVIWGFVGGSAALLLDVRTDYVLLAAGVALVIARMTQRRHGSSAAGRGTRQDAAFTTTCVIVWAVTLLVREWRRPRPASLLMRTTATDSQRAK
jgi:hypothetical protein